MFSIEAHIATTILSLMTGALIAFLLFTYEETLIRSERAGLGLLGGAIILSIAQTWTPFENPFSIWSQWVLRIGLLLYFGGKVFRLYRHRRNNQRAKDIAGAHFGVSHDKR